MMIKQDKHRSKRTIVQRYPYIVMVKMDDGIWSLARGKMVVDVVVNGLVKYWLNNREGVKLGDFRILAVDGRTYTDSQMAEVFRGYIVDQNIKELEKTCGLSKKEQQIIEEDRRLFLLNCRLPPFPIDDDEGLDEMATIEQLYQEEMI